MKRNTLTLAVMLTLLAGVSQVGAQGYSESAIMLTKTAVGEALADVKKEKEVISLGLPEVIQTAVANNYMVKSAEEAAAAAEAKIGVAKAARNPKLNYGYKFDRTSTKAGMHITKTFKKPGTGNVVGSVISTEDRTLPNNPVNTSGHALTLTMPLYTGGLIDGNIHAATYARDLADAKVVQAQTETKLEAAKAYFNALRAQNMLLVADQAVADLAKHLSTVNLQYKVGVAAKSDVLSTEVAVANTNTNRIKAKNAVDLSTAALTHTLSLPSHTEVHITDKEFGYKKFAITMEDAVSYALEHRPEVIQSALGVELARTQIDIAKAGFRPKAQMSVSKSFGHKSPAGDSVDKGTFLEKGPDGRPVDVHVVATPTGSATTWDAFVGVSWDLWDGGATAKQVKAAKATYASQKEQSANAISGITLQVKQAYLNLREAESIIQSTKVAADKAEDNFRIASLRYSAGVGTNLDVLDAELNLNKARNEYVDALYTYNVNVAALEAAMGTPVTWAIGEGLVAAQQA